MEKKESTKILWNVANPIPSMGLVYLPTWMVNYLHLPYKLTIHVGKYTTFPWILWEIYVPTSVRWGRKSRHGAPWTWPVWPGLLPSYPYAIRNSMLLLPLICIIWDAFFLRSGWWFDFCCCDFHPENCRTDSQSWLLLFKKRVDSTATTFLRLFCLGFLWAKTKKSCFLNVEGWTSRTPHEEDFFHRKMWGKIRKNPPYGTLLAEKCLKPPRNERFSKSFGIFLPKTWWMWPGPLPRPGVNYSSTKKRFFLEHLLMFFSIWHFFRRSSRRMISDETGNVWVLTFWVLTVQWFVLMILECWQVMVARRSFFEELGQCAAQLAPDFNPQNCSNAAWGLKVLDRWHFDLMHSWSFYLFVWQKHDISVHFFSWCIIWKNLVKHLIPSKVG